MKSFLRISLAVLAFALVIPLASAHGMSGSWLAYHVLRDMARPHHAYPQWSGEVSLSPLPNRNLTPGAIDPRVTQANLEQTICQLGYTRTIRPPMSYTERLKREGIIQYGYADRRLSHYEEDHLISLELGGSATNPANLWPEPHLLRNGWGSYTKDQVENRLHALVCAHRLSLSQAQYLIATNWIEAYQRYVAPRPIRGDVSPYLYH